MVIKEREERQDPSTAVCKLASTFSEMASKLTTAEELRELRVRIRSSEFDHLFLTESDRCHATAGVNLVMIERGMPLL